MTREDVAARIKRKPAVDVALARSLWSDVKHHGKVGSERLGGGKVGRGGSVRSRPDETVPHQRRATR